MSMMKTARTISTETLTTQSTEEHPIHRRIGTFRLSMERNESKEHDRTAKSDGRLHKHSDAALFRHSNEAESSVDWFKELGIRRDVDSSSASSQRKTPLSRNPKEVARNSYELRSTRGWIGNNYAKNFPELSSRTPTQSHVHKKTKPSYNYRYPNGSWVTVADAEAAFAPAHSKPPKKQSEKTRNDSAQSEANSNASSHAIAESSSRIMCTKAEELELQKPKQKVSLETANDIEPSESRHSTIVYKFGQTFEIIPPNERTSHSANFVVNKPESFGSPSVDENSEKRVNSSSGNSPSGIIKRVSKTISSADNLKADLLNFVKQERKTEQETVNEIEPPPPRFPAFKKYTKLVSTAPELTMAGLMRPEQFPKGKTETSSMEKRGIKSSKIRPTSADLLAFDLVEAHAPQAEAGMFLPAPKEQRKITCLDHLLEYKLFGPIFPEQEVYSLTVNPFSPKPISASGLMADCYTREQCQMMENLFLGASEFNLKNLFRLFPPL